jgi:hypothetical protein
VAYQLGFFNYGLFARIIRFFPGPVIFQGKELSSRRDYKDRPSREGKVGEKQGWTDKARDRNRKIEIKEDREMELMVANLDFGHVGPPLGGPTTESRKSAVRRPIFG